VTLVTRGRPSLKSMKEEFQLFIFDMSEMLEELQKLATRAGISSLDFSFESLDRVESLFALILDGKLALPEGASVDQFSTTISRYLGETLIRRVGGKWSFVKSPKEMTYGQPSIVEISGFPKSYEFLPLVVVRDYVESRWEGWLRSHAEQHDLAAMRARAAEFGPEMERELKALTDYVEMKRPASLPLDATVESLDRVEQVLGAALDEKAETRTLRQLSGRIARYMGEVFRRRAGGEWELCDDPRDVNFGEMRIKGFAPTSIVRNFELRRQPGLLKQAIASVLSRVQPR
jgi:hypothetical protein